MSEDWQSIFNKMTVEERKQMTATLLERSSRAKKHHRLSQKTLRLITAFLALVMMSIIVAKDHLVTGTLLALLYSSLFATYTLYSMLRLRLARQRVHWVGE